MNSIYLNGVAQAQLRVELLKPGDKLIIKESVLPRASVRQAFVSYGRKVRTYRGPYEGFYTVERRVPAPPKEKRTYHYKTAAEKEREALQAKQRAKVAKRRQERREWWEKRVMPAPQPTPDVFA